MRRRDAIRALTGVVTTWPSLGLAQQGGRNPRLAIVYPGAKEIFASSAHARIVDGLRQTGYAPPQIEIILRTAEGDPSRVKPMVAEVVGASVSLIIAISPLVVQAARAASPTIPILAHDLESDPVASGFADSVARPRHNTTGVFLDLPNLTGKWVELLREIKPTLSRLAVLWDPGTGRVQLEAVTKAADTLNIQIQTLQIRVSSDYEPSFNEASRHRADAVVLLSSPIVNSNAKLLSDLALRHRLPAISLFPNFAPAGGLLSYGPDLLNSYHQLGMMAGKILHGEKPGDLPIERPSTFQLIVNLKTAKAIGVELPPTLLARAEQVIE